MIRTHKRKLILSKSQEARLSSWIGACRMVYNLGMEIKNATYKATGKSVNKYDLMKQLPDLKDIDWIKDVPSQTLQSSLERLDRSYENFFKSYKKGGGYPKFASKRTYKSILLKSVRVDGEFVIIPKIKRLKIFKDSTITGTPKTAIIIKEPTGFFICIQCEDAHRRFESESQVIGLDMGISHFCIDSNGNFISNPRHFLKWEKKLRIENRALARKKKGSNRWKRQAEKLSLLHHKIGNIRKDFLHKESTKIAKQYSTVYIEDLNIRSMAKNKHLSKHILDCGWGMFKTMLEYKTSVVKINPKYTSQTCSECGEVDKRSRLSQSEFVCTSCGFVSNADVNAAINILSKGIALSRQRESIDCALTLEPHGL
jgi:putative transposase